MSPAILDLSSVFEGLAMYELATVQHATSQQDASKRNTASI